GTHGRGRHLHGLDGCHRRSPPSGGSLGDGIAGRTGQRQPQGCPRGPAFDTALPYLRVLAPTVTYVGEGERARLVKICHNLLLDVFTQALAETTVLAERGGIARADYLDFINGSVMGSTFTQYKTPAFVNLDFTPTF